jgi:hypothetical protein
VEFLRKMRSFVPQVSEGPDRGEVIALESLDQNLDLIARYIGLAITIREI